MHFSNSTFFLIPYLHQLSAEQYTSAPSNGAILDEFNEQLWHQSTIFTAKFANFLVQIRCKFNAHSKVITIFIPFYSLYIF